MKKYGFLFILVLLIVGFSQGVLAEDFEWYTVKDGVRGGLFLRKGPGRDSPVLEKTADWYFFLEPLFKVVGKEPNGMYKCLSNRNGVPRVIDYKYFHFWAAGEYLRKVDPEKEKLALLVPADYEYFFGINVYEKPHIFYEEGWGDLPNRWQYAYGAVKMTGKHVGPFIETFQLHGRYQGKIYFVLSEFFGFKNNSPFKKYPAVKILYTRSKYLNDELCLKRIFFREKPSILSLKAGYYGSGGAPVRVIGEQGDFYKTRDREYIFKQCLVEKKGK